MYFKILIPPFLIVLLLYPGKNSYGNIESRNLFVDRHLIKDTVIGNNYFVGKKNRNIKIEKVNSQVVKGTLLDVTDTGVLISLLNIQREVRNVRFDEIQKVTVTKPNRIKRALLWNLAITEPLAIFSIVATRNDTFGSLNIVNILLFPIIGAPPAILITLLNRKVYDINADKFNFKTFKEEFDIKRFYNKTAKKDIQ